MNPKAWRKLKDLTLEKLSEKMGFAVSYLSEVENGIKAPSGRLIIAYHEISKGQVGPADFEHSKKSTDRDTTERCAG